MKLRYAEVTSITSQDKDLFGFHHGMMIARHRVAVTEVCFTGGYRFSCLAQPDAEGGVMANRYRIEVGDRVRLMALPCGQVVNLVPEQIAHLPADMLLAAFVNSDLARPLGEN